MGQYADSDCGNFIASLYFFFRARDFDRISLGEETLLLSLGTNVEKLKRQSVAIISVIAGLTVASCGLIGLVGFISSSYCKALKWQCAQAPFAAVFYLWRGVPKRNGHTL